MSEARRPSPSHTVQRIGSRGTAALALRAVATGARAIGGFALAALAVGTVAIGALAVGRVAVGRARIGRLEIDELSVRRLVVTDELRVPQGMPGETGTQRDPATPQQAPQVGQA